MYGMIKKNRLAPWFGFDYADNLLDRVFSNFSAPGQTGISEPKVKISEDETNYYVKAEMPGISQEELELEYEDGVLTLRAEHKEEKEERDGEKVIYNEQTAYSYCRQFRLSQVDSEKAQASLKNGILEVTLPKKETAKLKKIPIGQ
jgi:HSP20 family protein